MKQMSLIEMDGFLKGECIPGDLKVNETNAEYLVRKFAELESKLETALRECRSAGITIDNLEAKCAALAAENEALKSFGDKLSEMHNDMNGEGTGIQGRAEVACHQVALEAAMDEFDAIKTPATDAFLAEVRAQGVKMVADILKVAGVCEHTYLDAANDLAAKVRNEASSAKIHCPETATDNTNQQFESLSRGDK